MEVKMGTILTIILAGILATGVMCAVMELITRSQLANADMVRAIGSLFTKSYDNALVPGLIIQFGFGIVFGFIYFAILSFFSSGGIPSGVVIGIVAGFFHGMVVSLAIVISVAEHHPLGRFREAGITVAMSHLAGHMIYGLTLGIVFGATGVRLFGNNIF